MTLFIFHAALQKGRLGLSLSRFGTVFERQADLSHRAQYPAVFAFTEILMHTRPTTHFTIGSITYALFAGPWPLYFDKLQVFEHFLVTRAFGEPLNRKALMFFHRGYAAKAPMK